MSKPYFMPYQRDWILDKSMNKIAEKSRRIGLTYVQSYEDVEDCIAKTVPRVWYSGTDESAAREYIDYCKFWAKSLNVVAKDLGELVLDEKEKVTAFSLQFSNKTRIHALSSNPSAFRSKGGKVVLDEFAFHKDANAMWAAAEPVTLWGYPLRILSTHNGKSCKYYKFVKDCKEGKLPGWSLHTTDIYKAVTQGLADRISGRTLTDKERADWIEARRRKCGDKTVWDQEYCCIAVDDATSHLPYDLIKSCESSNVLHSTLENITGDLFVGMDIARKKHLSVIWINEKLGDVLYTRQVIKLEKMKFADQQDILFSVLRHPRMRRCCIDETGIGMMLAENAVTAFGEYKVEPVTFTGLVKNELAGDLKIQFENKTQIIPDDDDIRDDFHSVQKFVTASGKNRFDAEASDELGHADRFWASALSVHASKGEVTDNEILTGGASESTSIIQKMQ